MNVVLLGPPGAGKGTLATALKERWGLAHISTGDILREEMKNNTEIGQKMKKIIEDGKLVPDEIVTQLIEMRLSDTKISKNGFMLDGFPRTKTQAEELDKILESIHKSIDYAFYMDAGLEVILDRLTGRRVCRQCGALYHIKYVPPKKEGVCNTCGGELYQRADDNETTIKTRMDVYIENTKPIVEYYEKQNKLQRINANKETQYVQKQLFKIINEDGKVNQNKDTR